MHNRVGGRQQPAVAPKASTVNWIVVAVREALFQLQPRVVCKSQRFGREFAEHRPSTVKRVECAVMGDGDWGKKCTLILHFNGKTVRKDMSMVSSWSGSATRRWLLCWAADLLSQLFGLHQTTVIRRRLFRFISVIVSFLFLLYQSVSYPYCRCSGTHKVEQECSTRSWLYSVLNSSDDVILFVEKKMEKTCRRCNTKKKCWQTLVTLIGCILTAALRLANNVTPVWFARTFFFLIDLRISQSHLRFLHVDATERFNDVSI